MSVHDLSMHDLKAVAMVAQHRHFGKAAAALGVAQPTLSAQVQRAERALSATLFERGSRRFLITREGEQLLPLLREVLAAADRLDAEASGPRTSSDHLRLGIIPTLGPYLMPHLLMPLRRDAGAPELTITERPTAGLIAALLDGTLDAAILSLPVREAQIERLSLFDEPFRLIAARESEIISVPRLVPSALSACDMVLLEEGHCLREQAVAVCGKRGGISPRVVTASLETLKYLVATGGGYSLLPALACDIPSGLAPLVRVRDFDDRTPSRRIALCFRTSHTRHDRMLHLARFIRQHPPPGVVRVAH